MPTTDTCTHWGEHRDHLGKQELPHAVTPTWRCVDVHLDGQVCRDAHEASMKMHTYTSLAVFQSPQNTASVITVVKQQRSESLGQTLGLSPDNQSRRMLRGVELLPPSCPLFQKGGWDLSKTFSALPWDPQGLMLNS